MATDNKNLLGSVLGECELERVIGQGGMSSVYLGRQLRPTRYVAVKVLGSQMISNNAEDYQVFLTRFRREADIVAKLEHVNIMPLYAYGEENRFAYIIMPYISGGSLSDAISKQGKLSLQQTFIYLQQAAAALDYAHGRNIVHRDLKPSNFLLYPEGNRLVLADFGIARITAANPYATQETTLTQAGTMPGTLAYMAPEMLRDSKNIDYRVDIYALGIVLYQMLSGDLPFRGSLFELINKHLSEPLPLLHKRDPAIPTSIDSVLSRATAKAREERYSTASELASDFHRALNSVNTEAAFMPGGWNVPVVPSPGIPASARDNPMQQPSSESNYSGASAEIAEAIYPLPVRDNVTSIAEGNNYPSLRSRNSTSIAGGNVYPSQQVYEGVGPAESSTSSASPPASQASPPAQNYRQAANRDKLILPSPSNQNRPPQGVAAAEYSQQPRRARRPQRRGIVILIAILLVAGGLITFWATARYNRTPAPVPVAVTPAMAAEQVIQEYYSDVNERNYKAAFNLLTPEFQNYLGYDGFVRGYANTKHDSISFGKVSQTSISNVSVPTTIRAIEAKPQGDVTNTYHILYTVVHVSGNSSDRGTWKIQGGVST